jgi:hypothetical protein
VSVVRQRADADCGCGALANLTGESYEDCYVAVAAIDRRHRGKNGLHNREVIAAARLMGMDLIPTRRYDLDEDEGILRVRWNDPKKRKGGHFVAIVNAKVRCPSGEERDWRDYLELYGARAGTLLKGSL